MRNVIRQSPFREWNAARNQMNQLMEQTWRDARPAPRAHALPLDIHETDDTYTVVTDIPGLNAEQINISLDDGVLTIDAVIEREELDENTRVLKQERHYGPFSRSIRLPQEVDVEAIEAEYHDGVLALSLPKAPEAKPRQITVKASGKA